MNQQMPQIKNQALRFVSFLLGTLSIIFLLIIFVISTEFYNFKEIVTSNQSYLSNLHELESDIFAYIDEDLSVSSKELIHKKIKISLALMKESKPDQSYEKLNENLENNWKDYVNNEITKRQYENNTRNIMTKLEELLGNEMVTYSLKFAEVQRFIILYSVLIFLFSAILLWIISKRWLSKVSIPFLAVAEELLKRGNLAEPLNLPQADYFEQEHLNRTLTTLWNELRNLDYIKLKQIKYKNLKLQTILMSIDDIVFVVDAENCLTQANEQFLTEFGISASSYGSNWSDLDFEENSKINFETLVNAKNETITELTFKASGKTFLSRKRKVIDEDDGTFYGTLYMLEDITKEIEIQKTQKEFVAVLSHELKTPIQSLTTASELLSDFQNDFESPEYKIVTDTLLDDIKKVKTITEDFVRFSKSDISTLAMNQRHLLLSKEIISILEPLRLLINDKNIKIKLDLDPNEDYLVNLDSTKFNWAICNIILNAYRVSPTESQITIKSQRAGKLVEVWIADEGSGIDAEEQKAIFKPFYQGKKSGSFGLGLTIAKQVIDSHGGSLTYMDNVPNGAIFIIRLDIIEDEYAGCPDTLS